MFFMLKIRLKRVGRKHDPSYRVILTESTSAAKTGNVIETLGSYDPRKDRDSYRLESERITHWISKGAQPSDTVHNILVSAKVINAKKINVIPKRILEKPAEKEETSAEAKTETEAPHAAEAASTEASETASSEAAPVEEAPAETA
jgi:small subunit ribosomal protein S16